jgi:hypothetical protein
VLLFSPRRNQTQENKERRTRNNDKQYKNKQYHCYKERNQLKVDCLRCKQKPNLFQFVRVLRFDEYYIRTPKQSRETQFPKQHVRNKTSKRIKTKTQQFRRGVLLASRRIFRVSFLTSRVPTKKKPAFNDTQKIDNVLALTIRCQHIDKRIPK